MNKSLDVEMKQLEEQLLHSDFRARPDLLDEFLSDDFEELSPSGYISSREDVVGWLMKKDAKARWLLTDFSVRELSDDLVLTVYKARSKTNNKNKNGNNNPSQNLGSLRSSIWRRNGKTGAEITIKWQMIFHSGTKILSSEHVK